MEFVIKGSGGDEGKTKIREDQKLPVSLLFHGSMNSGMSAKTWLLDWKIGWSGSSATEEPKLPPLSLTGVRWASGFNSADPYKKFAEVSKAISGTNIASQPCKSAKKKLGNPRPRGFMDSSASGMIQRAGLIITPIVSSMTRLFESFCARAGRHERESEPAFGRGVQSVFTREPQNSNLESQSIFRDCEFERIAPTLLIAQYNRCVRHFSEHGQYTPVVQSLAALINIRLPYQRLSHVDDISLGQCVTTPPPFVPLRLYIRRLIVTAQDSPDILLAFFGDTWDAGVGGILKEERLNYLFMAKSGGWVSTKAAYDIEPDEQTPFLRPLRNPSEHEIQIAEVQWSEWLAMEDWMVGERSPW